MEIDFLIGKKNFKVKENAIFIIRTYIYISWS